MKQMRERVKLNELVIAANQNVKEKEYWLNQLSGELAKTTFPYDYNGGMTQRRMEAVKFSFSRDLYERLMVLSKESERKLNMALAAGLAALLYKYTGSSDIIMGTPIYKQKTEGNFINTVLILRQNIHRQATFKDLLLDMRQTLLNAIEHRDYPVEILADQLNLPVTDHDDFPLFDVAYLLENIHEKSYINHINCNMIFSFLKNGENIQGIVEYNAARYETASIKRIIDHFSYLMKTILFKVDLQLSAVGMLSDTEKQLILEEFNNTKTGVVRDKCFHQLFEEQVEKSPDSTAAVHRTLYITYGKLNEEANRAAHLLAGYGCKPGEVTALYMKRSIKILVAILGTFKAGGAYLPIENDYPGERVKRILENSSVNVVFTGEDQHEMLKRVWQGETDEKTILCLNKDDEEDDILQKYSAANLESMNKPDDFAYIIYTSGSTGEPKGVMIHHLGMINHLFAKINDLTISPDDIIAQTASICFDISVWQFLSGLLVGGRTLIIDKEIILDPLWFLRILQKEKVTILETIPSLMTRFLQAVKNEKDRELKHLRWMIPTGEVLGVHLVREWFHYYPGIKLVNAYGPTEASDDVTHYFVKEMPAENQVAIPIGKPVQNMHIYIMDIHSALCPIGVRGEICAAGIGVGKGYLKDPEKTKKCFVPNPLADEIGDKDYGTLYKTGDVGCYKEDGNIEIFGRIDDQVKIRGNRIELGEIENCLLNYDGIKETLVLAKDDDGQKGDKYLCAYLTAREELDKSQLRDYLTLILPDYMIPPYFIQLDQFPLTSNGKIDRKALPGPQLEASETYIPPRNKLEEKLVELWAGVLEIEKDIIGIDSNFFELGGDSLTGTILVSQIHKALNVKVPFPEIFRKPQIRLLSEYIEQLEENRYSSIVVLEKKEYYPLSSAQKRMFILQQMDLDDASYNMMHTAPLTGLVDKDKLTSTFKGLIKRHESLRTSFDFIGEQPVQKIHPGDIDFKIRYADLDEITLRGSGDIMGTTMARDFLGSFDLSTAPLLRVGIVKINEDLNLMIINMHHIISDAASGVILEEDFLNLYRGETLPPLKIQYKEYSQWQNSEKVRQAINKQKMFWLKEFEDEIPILDLPTDYPRPSVWSSEGKNVHFKIGEKESQALHELGLAEDTTLFLVLFSIFNILVYKITNQEDIVIGTPVVGRMHADLEGIVGMFVNTLPLRNFPHHDQSFTGFLKEVHDRSIEAFENQEYQFEDLVDELSVNRDPSRNPIFDIMFALQEVDGESNEPEDKYLSALHPIVSQYEYERAKFDLTLHAFAAGENISFSFEYSTNLFKEETINRLVRYFMRIVSVILDDTGKRISQIEMMSEAEKKQLLFDFNNTNTAYPQEKTIHKLFEEQVNKTPDTAALVFKGQQLSYSALNDRANRLAWFLRVKGVREDTIVALMVERSLEMLTGLMAVLKAGGAYLPIDPQYPQERITYMLNESAAIILLTQQKPGEQSYNECHHAHTREIVYLCKELLYDEAVKSGIEHKSIPGNRYSAYVIYTSGSTGKPKGVVIDHKNVINFITGITGTIGFSTRKSILALTTVSFDISVLETLLPLVKGLKVVIATQDQQKDPQLLADKIVTENVNMMQMTPSSLKLLIDSDIGISCLADVDVLMVGGESLPQDLFECLKVDYKGNVYNMYGPTETTIWSTIRDLTGVERIDIGMPIANTLIYIFDAHYRLLPVGVAGELFIGGDGVGRGYLNNPEMTAERFGKAVIRHSSFIISNSLKTNVQCPMTNDRLYQTGDLVRWLPDGNIEFLGRIDQQVKIRGFRIEPGEIETQLMNHHQVKNAAVITKEEANSEKNLCAYIVSGGELNVLEVREFLSGELPYYMIPAYFYQVEEIPLTDNGKVDRKKLATYESTLDSGIEYIAPSTDMEKKITGIWKDILKLDKVGVMDDFFLVGGNSLKVILLYRRLREELSLDFSVATLFDRVTVGSFVQYLLDREKEDSMMTNKEIKRVAEINKARERKRKQITRRRIGVSNELS